MTDSRQKGQRAEYAVRDLLRAHTGLAWERVPGSGGFGQSHGLKGDIYLPPTTGKISAFTIEVKHYADDVLNANIFNDTVSQLEKFWQQTLREAGEMSAKPMLVFKKDRGKWICAITIEEANKLPNLEDLGALLTLEKSGQQFMMFNFEKLLQKTEQKFWIM